MGGDAPRNLRRPELTENQAPRDSLLEMADEPLSYRDRAQHSS